MQETTIWKDVILVAKDGTPAVAFNEEHVCAVWFNIETVQLDNGETIKVGADTLQRMYCGCTNHSWQEWQDGLKFQDSSHGWFTLFKHGRPQVLVNKHHVCSLNFHTLFFSLTNGKRINVESEEILKTIFQSISDAPQSVFD